MRMQMAVDQRWHEEVVDLLVRYVRPSKLRLHANLSTIQLLVTSDGKRTHSRIFTEARNPLNQQFVVQPTPAELSLRQLLSATEIVSVEKPDEMQSVLMNLPCPLPISQLTLLFDPSFMQQLIESSTAIERLPDRPLGGRDCMRVQLMSPSGTFVFWIDGDDRLLRRIEYPSLNPTSNGSANEAVADTNVKPPTPAPIRLSVDYDNVQVNGVFPPSSFRQQAPPSATSVHNFVVPPMNEAAHILGRRVSNYWFTDLKGQKFSVDQLNATVNVLVWFNNRAPSRAVLQQLASVHDAYPDSVQFLGICTEPTTVMSHDDVRQLQFDWQIPFPVVRDLEAFGRDVFAIQQAPTLVALTSTTRSNCSKSAATPR